MQASVVIPAYNSAPYIKLQLLSLLRQSFMGEYEVIIVDNGSKDNLYEVVSEIIGSSPVKIKIIDASEIQSANYARNVGIRNSSGENILFCDADDAVNYHWVENGVEYLKEFLVWSGEAENINEEDYSDNIQDIQQGLDDKSDKDYFLQSGPFQVLMGGNCGFRKKFLTDLGGFDVAAPSQCDDDELARRLVTSGYNIPVVKGCRIAYRIKSDTASKLTRTYNGAYAHAWLVNVYNTGDTLYPKFVSGLIKTHALIPFINIFYNYADKDSLKARKFLYRGYFMGMLKAKYNKKWIEQKIGLGL